VQNLKESFILGGFNSIRVRYLGENSVLLSEEGDEAVKKMVKENKKWFDSIFNSVSPWDDDFVNADKYIWVKIRGLPLKLWSGQCLESIVAMVGTLIEVDEATLEKNELEYTRVYIRLLVAWEARWVKYMRINDIMCQISI